MTAPPAEAPPLRPAKRLLWLLLDIAVWILIAAALALMILLRVLPEFERLPFPINDRAVRNLGSFLFGALAVFMTWGWVSFFSGYSLSTKRVVFVGLPAGIAFFLATVRIEGFDGNMVIRIGPRW